MPVLAGYLGSIFTAIVAFLSTWLTRRVAVVLAAVAAIGTVFTAFYSAILALYSSIAVGFPVVPTYFGCFLPTNIDECLSVILTAMLLRWVYDWQVKIIQLKLL